ncbi:TetR/AcrR family transcriptional regulator [Martelella sp. AD-3]|uniref:TetR/AcrR family transcriptional regulator n=1 Tax=Martelella sp. AD-3 TaxID=686597 RepID=UPI0004647AD8|nr:TetR/AcrR family transcriptional regulator [Martelella sp. AD-3]AMM84055.1 hypothetical protein AZF01_06530 [Martelella sp. AD-3]
MPRTRDEEQVRIASEACLRVFALKGPPATCVAELAEAAGINERKFYRWFSTKEQSIRPALEAGAKQFRELVDQSDMPLPQATIDAFAEVIWNDNRERSMALYPAIFGDPVTWAVFLDTIDNSQVHLVATVAKKMRIDKGSMAARLAAAAITSAVRFALQDFAATGDDPRPNFEKAIQAYQDGVFSD